MTEASPKPRKIIPDPELPPEQCQRIRILDVDKPIQHVFYECWHCQTGLMTECSGKPIIEDFNGRPSVQEIKVKCPNCEKSAVKLITGEVLSTIAIPSPWGDKSE